MQSSLFQNLIIVEIFRFKHRGIPLNEIPFSFAVMTPFKIIKLVIAIPPRARRYLTAAD